MKIKIITIIIISAVLVSFASSRAAKNKTVEKQDNLTNTTKSSKSAGFVSEEL